MNNEELKKDESELELPNNILEETSEVNSDNDYYTAPDGSLWQSEKDYKDFIEDNIPQSV